MAQTKAQLISGASSQSVTFNDVTASSLNGGPFGGARNRIINGDMRIDQRNAGAAVTASVTSTRTHTLDRWGYYTTAASKFTIQQNAGSVTPPAGFTNYLGITSSSAYSVTASDLIVLQHVLEGFNTSDFAFGTANAKTVTLSFWVRSSLTGTFGGSLVNQAGTRSYPFSYTISAANTWEQKSITIAGDTSGTWLTDNNLGIHVNFQLGTGSTYTGTAGAWAGAAYWGTTGATNIVATNGATFYITGVQLEAGSVATPFERRSYGQELALCQRYYCKTYNQEVAPGSASSAGSLFVYKNSNNNAGWNFNFPVQMRTTPSFTTYSQAGTAGKCTFSTTDVTALTNGGINGSARIMVYANGAIADDCYVHVAASAEL